mmetsp:Transcript_61691/g.198762  ORF Transcript_61691/g.198762 Transcript_61691/m.198762 type:complete len:271 (+) Transcript_61691:820-1632(+)
MSAAIRKARDHAGVLQELVCGLQALTVIEADLRLPEHGARGHGVVGNLQRRLASGSRHGLHAVLDLLGLVARGPAEDLAPGLEDLAELRHRAAEAAPKESRVRLRKDLLADGGFPQTLQEVRTLTLALPHHCLVELRYHKGVQPAAHGQEEALRPHEGLPLGEPPGGVHRVHDPLPRHEDGHDVEGEGNLLPVLAGHVHHPSLLGALVVAHLLRVELPVGHVVVALEVRRHLEDTATPLSDGLADRADLVSACQSARGQRARGVPVHQEP